VPDRDRIWKSSGVKVTNRKPRIKGDGIATKRARTIAFAGFCMDFSFSIPVTLTIKTRISGKLGDPVAVKSGIIPDNRRR
jgi:hypothetical protein